jgi:ketosteroid isomerase-like protein
MKINVMKSITSVLVIVLMSKFGLSQSQGGSIQSLVEAEKVFAAMASERGFRDSFLANFTEEGIAFSPAPGRSNEGLRKLPPPPPGPPKNKLKWRPEFSDISVAGDLGYNTGPFWVEGPDGKDLGANQGYFFSLWKWQPDSTWKVVLDMGARAALPETQRSLPWAQAGSKPYRAGKNETRETQISDLRKFEDGSRPWSVKEYEKVLATESRFHTDGTLPILGSAKVLAQLRSRAAHTIKFTSMFADVADSSDLGYTYGSYELSEVNATERGYYTHVWKRNPLGKWELVAEIRSPAPTDEKKQ